jgi:hypothetical protein
MAGVELKDITRDKVSELVKDAKKKNKNRKIHVREELTRQYPGIETITIKRNGSVYNALDYLMEDVEAYAGE